MKPSRNLLLHTEVADSSAGSTDDSSIIAETASAQGDLWPRGLFRANTEGGVIVLGVTDRGEIIGVRENADNVQERLTAFLHTGCSAPVSARTGRQRRPQRLGALG